MEKTYKFGIVLAIVFALAYGAVLPSASATSSDSPIKTTGDIVNLANKVGNWVATLFWIAATIAIFYAAFLYLTAAGDEQKVDKAKRQLIYAVIAITIGLLAFGMPAIIRSFLNLGNGGSSGGGGGTGNGGGGGAGGGGGSGGSSVGADDPTCGGVCLPGWGCCSGTFGLHSCVVLDNSGNCPSY